MTLASGIGSWPGTDPREPMRVLRELFGGLDPVADGVTGVPYLPELPDRGPGGDLLGRTAGLLVDLPVDLQPAGWRLVDRPGRDAARTGALWREDLDVLAECYDGYAGPLKLAVAGPWTLAAGLSLTRGERVINDRRAARDVAESLAEGVRTLLATVARLVPGAEVILQLDEPSLPAVLEGRLPTASGFGRLPAVDPLDAVPALAGVLSAVGERHTLVHCCAAHPPQPLLRRAGAGGLSVDTALLTPRGWEGLAVAVEEGRRVWAGAVPTDGVSGVGPAGHATDAVTDAARWPTPPAKAPGTMRAEDLADGLAGAWERIGLPAGSLADLAVTPSCGLAGLSPAAAVARQRLVVDVARELAHRAAG